MALTAGAVLVSLLICLSFGVPGSALGSALLGSSVICSESSISWCLPVLQTVARHGPSGIRREASLEYGYLVQVVGH